MKVLVLGGTGMLGHKLVQVLQPELDVWATVKSQIGDFERYNIIDESKIIDGLDVADFSSVEMAIRKVEPQVVINAIGIIKQLPSAGDVVTTLMVNSVFPHRLADLAANRGFKLVCISTDCVFDGSRGNYSEDDAPNALDLYGTSKRLGEVITTNCLTLRTSIIGRELRASHSLVEWFLSNRGKSVQGFVNAVYTGFPTIVFAHIVKRLLIEYPSFLGLYNVSSDAISKYELLQLIKSRFELDIDIRPNEEFRIDRSLDSNRFRTATGITPPSWDEMIDQMAKDPTPYEQWRRATIVGKTYK